MFDHLLCGVIANGFQAGDPQPKVTTATTTAGGSTANTGMGLGLYAVAALIAAAAFMGYQYFQSQETKA